ncbi:hypothetical protein ABFS83_14G211400 [Erythranthe nasuta]
MQSLDYKHGCPEWFSKFRRSSKNEISKLQSPPQNSTPTRLHHRCFSTGRPRANYRDFGLSGHILREMAYAYLLPRATRSSW